MAKNAVGLAIATEEYGAKFFANGAAPGGVLEHPGTIKDPQKVKESWNSAYQGSQNAHRVAVLEEGHEVSADRHLTRAGAVFGNPEVSDKRNCPYFQSAASYAC